jgi:uncharacterized protein
MLDLAAVRARLWRPTPFQDVVVKVHQHCNLACDYCYVYTMADQSWRSRPAVMATDIEQATAARIAEHASTYRLDGIRIILHGGEPLLAGIDRLSSLIELVRKTLPAHCCGRFGLQTNGVLLTEHTLARLQALDVKVGVSLDGRRPDQDRHRRYANGRGSFNSVARGLGLLSTRYRSIFDGLLCVVDLDSDPVRCYNELLQYRPPAADFLLPHANWSSPPRRSADDTDYGDWLTAVFDRWYEAPRQEMRVRIFEDLISLVLGGSARSEQIGLSPVAVVVIETDGEIEQVDSLKSTYAGATSTSLNVRTDTLSAALNHPGVVARQIGAAALSDTCLNCPVHRICGGGHYAHRYRATSGFRNPSVYCHDLRRVIEHVRDRVDADIRSRIPGGYA